MSNLKLELSEEQLSTIRILVNSLAGGLESVFESDFTFIEEENPGLYHALVDLHDTWDSSEIRDALEIWEGLNH